MTRRLCALVALAASLALAATASAGAATTWTPVASGTTQQITAIDYHSDTQAWYATSNGQLAFTNGSGAFQVTGSFPGRDFTDIKFNAAGTVGYAVTLGGQAYRSIDGGATWAAVTLGTIARSGCGAGPTPLAVPRLNAVVWGDANTVYLLGGSSSTAPLIARSANATAATPTFADVNQTGGICRIGDNDEYITDGFVLPADPTYLTFITEYFGATRTSTDGLVSPTALPETGEMINNTDNAPRLAVDPDDPSHIWAVDHASSGSSQYFEYSQANGAADTRMTIVGSPTVEENLYDVGFAGGTLVAAGDGGEIYTSIDGTDAYLQPAPSNPTTNWRAVGVASGTNALVGGDGGALVKSATINSVPDTTPPTGTIGGPSALNVGQAGTYTAAVADEAGGSGINPASLAWTSDGTPGASGATASFAFGTPGYHAITLTFSDNAGNVGTTSYGVFVSTPAAAPAGPAPAPTPPKKTTSTTPPNVTGKPITRSSGGAKVVVYGGIKVKKGRYVPVTLSTKPKRNFIIEILTSKKPYHHVSTVKTSLKKNGKKLVKVALPKKIKTGRYLVVVRVFNGKKGIGRDIRVAFIVS